VVDQAASSVPLHRRVLPPSSDRRWWNGSSASDGVWSLSFDRRLQAVNRSCRLAPYNPLLQCLSLWLAQPFPVLLGLGFDGMARQAVRRQLGCRVPAVQARRAPIAGQLQRFGNDGIKSKAAPLQSLTEKAREREIGSWEERDYETERSYPVRVCCVVLASIFFFTPTHRAFSSFHACVCYPTPISVINMWSTACVLCKFFFLMLAGELLNSLNR
jgi:hypothetical protein